MFTIMREWMILMNKTEIARNMIAFIEEKEKELQASKLSNEKQARTDIVKSILDRLDGEITNENQQN